ncbi:MAG: hypothetical protein H6825_06000 [Planctomycetes bacterium]|nr:hypothetical protein [Planctomycetota bacterium]
MRRPIVSLTLVVLALPGCGGPSGRRLTADEYVKEQQDAARAASPATSGTAAFDALQAGDGTSGTATSEAAPATTSAREELEFALSDLLARKERLALEHAVASDEAALAIASSERALRHASEDLEHFQSVEVQRILLEDSLELAEVRDQKAALAAELAELERLYGGPGIQAPGAQAMLDRARRDLERAEERLTLREARSTDLRDRELPRRIEDLAAAVAAATTAHESATRLAQAGTLQRTSERVQLERDETRLRERLSALPRARSGGSGGSP